MNGKKVLAALCVCALAVLSACGQGYADPSGSGSGENVGSVASSGSTGNAWESSAAGSEDSGTEAARRLAERREYISRYRERICAYGSYTPPQSGTTGPCCASARIPVMVPIPMAPG